MPGDPANLASATLAVAAFVLLALGLSYLLQAPAWLRFLRGILAEPGLFFPGALVMVAAGASIGLLVNDWSDTRSLFVTLLGWLMALEGALFLVWPQPFQAFQALPDRFLLTYMRLGGAILVALGVWLVLPLVEQAA